MLGYPHGLTLDVEISEGEMFDFMLEFFIRKNGEKNLDRWERWLKVWEE